MNLNDIIKTDKDRLFQIDDECYVLFTGDSLDDEQPFIRIGNWINMPAELIPLIRNIVITDNLTGNPAYEQFNIDPENLKNNRYIGSSEVMRPYIEFQKLSGIDLSKVEIVDIKKDLPEFSMGKNISDDDQFIGVFYRDGSFKTLHKGNTILELKDKETKDLFDAFSENSPRLALLDNSLTFAGQSAIISYELPLGGIDRFKELGINYGPEALVHTSNNYINLLPFLKSKKSGKINIYTSKNDDIRTIKRFFANLSLNMFDIASIRYGSSADLLVENYPGSINIRAAFNYGPHIAFAKSTEGIQQVLKDKLDGIIIPYSTYKESVLLFKSTSTPIAIINDTNENIYPRLAINITPLWDNSLYRLLKASPEELARRYGNTDELIERLKTINPDVKAEHKEFFNIMSLIRLKINSSTDRIQYKELQKLHHEFQSSLKPYDLFEPDERPVFTLAFCNGGIYQFADTVADKKIADRKKYESEKNLKIAEDRKRLERLLALYVDEGSLGLEKARNTLEKLRSSLEQRKETYAANVTNHRPAEQHPIFSSLSKIKSIAMRYAPTATDDTKTGIAKNDDAAFYEKSTLQKQDTTQQQADILAANRLDRHEQGKKPLESETGVFTQFLNASKRTKAALVIVPLAIIAIFFLILGNQKTQPPISHDTGTGSPQSFGQTGEQSPAPTGTGSSQNIGSSGEQKLTPSDTIFDEQKKTSYEAMPAEFKSTITQTDIYNYTNRVAIKNGYRELSSFEMKFKNPNLIFPQEAISMLDDQLIIVVNRDTLWNISERKLMEIDLAFYEIIKQIETAPQGKRKKLIEQANSIAFSEGHKKILNSL